jgi:hypothetical protein
MLAPARLATDAARSRIGPAEIFWADAPSSAATATPSPEPLTGSASKSFFRAPPVVVVFSQIGATHQLR